MGSIVRAINNVGTAVWFGGTLMGCFALNPAVEVLDDPEERGKMVDEGWARFQPWGAAGLGAAMVTHFIMRRNPPRRPSSTYKTASLAKDVLMLVAGVSSLASMALGEYAMHAEPDAYTPIEQGTEPSAETPEDAEKAQSGLTLASTLTLLSGLGILVTGAILQTERER
jgi:uncharacterized membrane protein